MTLTEFIDRIDKDPHDISFDDTIATIDAEFDFTPVAFSVGSQHNEAGTNLGSCRILAFAYEMNLSKEATLDLFGDYYRTDVLQHPDGQDHANIRQFMRHGWKGVHFSDVALKRKPASEVRAEQGHAKANNG